MEWLRKLAGFLRRDAIEAELREEMRTHIEMKASASGNVDSAQRQFRNTTLLLEDAHEAWGWPRPEAWLRDFRYAVRGLARKPAFSATVVLTLALGIGASSTIFSLIDAVLLRPLPYSDPDRLVALQEAKLSEAGARTPVSPGRLEDWQRLTQTLSAVAGSYPDVLTDTTAATPERLAAAFFSPRFFQVLETAPEVGRVLSAEEERFGGPAAIVISDALWRRRFAADPGAVGRSLILEGQSYTIAGVMPASFQYPTAATDVWAPKQARPGLLRIREARFYNGVGRLKRGVTIAQARDDMDAVQKRLGKQYPKTDAGWNVTVEPLKDRLVGDYRRALWLLLGAVGVLLLIACANVACLLLARLNSRAAEIATRCSLGAGRAAIARQLLAEGLVYSIAGGVVGLAVTYAGAAFLRARLADVPRIEELSVDARILAVVGGVSVFAAMLFSVAPIFQVLRRNLTGSLVRGARGIAGGRQRLPRVLVSAQFALATALVICAGLFMRSLMKLEDAPLGFQPENVLTLRVSASFNEAADAAVQRHQRTLDALSVIPSVTAVSMASGLPGVNAAWPREFQIAGEAAPDGALRFAAWRMVTAGYFQTVGISIVAGHTCRMATEGQSQWEALINRSFAQRYFVGRDPIGRTIMQGPQGNTEMRIVGVVADARENGPRSEPQPLIYGCGYLRYWPDSNFLIQTRYPGAVANMARERLRAIEPSRPVYAVLPLAGALDHALSQPRFRTLLIGLFSMMALTLAAIGLYGVMAYMVSQRTREIGIRVALGARPREIVAEILRSGASL
ncbi:MAG TPA: ABC transporter permease, partial [Candidatus Solibacter sp.]|nr:ABC transporter permease [Candidatus Solibacter sp.]